MSDNYQQPPPPSEKKNVPWRLIAGLVIVVLVVVFCLENTKTVPIRFVGPVVHARLFYALIASAVLGSLATLLFQRHRRK